MQPLPGATAAGVTMDYIAFDPATRFLWAPAATQDWSSSLIRRTVP
jgi:hypothetical protein